MALESGTRLGSYEISDLLGKGGMGEVYRARDTKLGREVAIKTLPPEFAQDADRLARFEREAKLLASLNHSNIAAIYGLEEHEGSRFLVLELVEGDTLGDRIKRGAIPVEESLKLALQIADALKAAHESGVIHRDLKPDNIKVSDDGNVKVLDFGLAKAMAAEETDAAVSNSPTLSMAATQAGVILGTAAYMSPEQAKGRSVDRRADVWAFGCVLYEMLSGRQSFGKSDVTESLSAVISLQPEWDALPRDLHPRLRETVERCLQKPVAQRYQDIGDVKNDIEQVLADPDGVIVKPVEAVVQAKSQSKLPWVAAIVLAGLTGLVVWNLRPPPVSGPVGRFDYDLPDGHNFRNVGRNVIALSPEGSYFVYSTTQGLYLRSIDDLEPRLISGTEAATIGPFIKPDGQWVGYFREGQIQKIAINGGAPVPVASNVGNTYGASWGTDDMILYGQTEGIMRVSENGGTPQLVIPANAGEQLASPQLLRDDWVLFTAGRAEGWDDAQIVAQSIESGERKPLWTGSDARYVPTGHIVYALGNDLFAIPFDLATLEVTGGAVALVEGLVRAGTTASANYGVSDNGSLVYLSGSALGLGLWSMVWVDRAGDEELIGAEPRNYAYPRISPDGGRVALDVRDEEDDILLWDFTRETLSRFTPSPASEQYPVWTPDGLRIAYGTVSGVDIKASDGGGIAETILEITDPSPYFFSPSGTELVFRAVGPNGESVAMISLEGDAEPVWLLNSGFTEQNAEASSDGNWMAYQSDESGEFEIYVSPFPDTDGGKQQVSTGGGVSPRWSWDGEEMFYVEPGPPARLMAVPVQTEPGFDSGNPQGVLDLTGYNLGLGGGRTYDVSRDGQRFLLFKDSSTQDEDTAILEIITVLNWFEELKERVPVP